MDSKFKIASLLFVAVGVGFAVGACSTDEEPSAPPESSSTVPAHSHTLTHYDRVEPTCTGEGHVEYYLCSECGKYFDASKNEINESDIILDAIGHDYGDWVVTVEPTDTNTGIKTRTCKHDSTHVETDTVPAKGHTYVFDHFEWSSDFHTATAVLKCENDNDTKVEAASVTSENTALCTEPGVMVYTAHYENFHEAQNGEVTPAKGHIDSEPYIDSASYSVATCTVDGGYDLVTECIVCGKETSRITNVSPALKHSYTNYETVTEATCTEDGLQISYCDHDHDHEVSQKVIAATGHTYKVTTVQPKCLEQGYDLHECTKCDESYKDNFVSALGHRDENGDLIVASCIGEQDCHYCDATVLPVGHDYQELTELATSADCTHHGTSTYECSRCHDKFTENTSEPLGHDYDDIHVVDQVREGMDECYREKVYACTSCGHPKTVTYEKHSYKAVITTEGTCSNSGVKTYTCTVCGDSYTVPIPKNPENHVWNLGTPVDGERVDTCDECGLERTVKVVTGDTSANSLKDQEFAVGEASSIKIDESVIDGLKGTDEDFDLNITVNTVDKDSLPISDEQKEQIGDEDVYDFSLSKNSVQVDEEFDGYITITLPYNLDGKDPEHVAIWYISDSGGLSTFKATYANGYVTFSTNHFSCYAVTSLTKEEACARYGHAWVYEHVDGDCTHGAYDIMSCTRCGATSSTTPSKPSGHNFVAIATTEATCTDSGSIISECINENCHIQKTEIIPALGHDYGDPIEHVDATCEKAGYSVYKCSRCPHEKTVYQYANGHEYALTETVAPTCESYGYDIFTCSHCGKTNKTNYEAPLEHNYEIDSSASIKATCTESGKNVYVCSHDHTHTYTEIVPATGHTASEVVELDYVDPTCTHDGSHDEVTYCVTCGYEISRVHITDKATGHTPAEAVKENISASSCEEPGSYDSVVYCDVCHEELSRETIVTDSVGHVWGGWVGSVDPTCTEKGEQIRYCENDHNHFETREVDALGHTPAEAVKENELDPTCTTDGGYDLVVYCSECGEELSREEVVIPATGHNYGAWVKTTDPTCTTEGVETRTCANDPTHIETRPIAATGHVHTHVITENNVEPTCILEGHYDSVTICDDCEEEVSRTTVTVEALGHQWSEWENISEVSCTEDLVQRRHCLRDGCLEEEERTLETAGGHIYELKYENVVAPTCTTDGHHDEVLVCSSCNEHDESSRVTIVDKATGHTPLPEVKENEVAPGCETEGGYDMVSRCKTCGEVVTSEHVTIPAIGHNYGAWEVTKEATCTEEGIETKVCATDHNHTEIRSIPAKGHVAGAPVNENEVEPTCTEVGSYDSVVYCSVCGDELSRETIEIPELGHEFSEWEVTSEPTCKKEGVESRHCIHEGCEEVETRPIDIVEHVHAEAVKENEKDAGCTTKGYYDSVIYCSECGDELSRTKIYTNPIGHNYVLVDIEISEDYDYKVAIATFECEHCHNQIIKKVNTTSDQEIVCYEKRTITYTAVVTYNGKTYTETLAVPGQHLAHTPGQVVFENEVPATCTKAGSHDEVVYCTVCEQVITREKGVVDRPLGHLPNEAHKENVVNPTCTEEGSYDIVVDCDRCGEVLSSEHHVEEALGHDYGEWITVKEATCEHEGQDIRVCSHDQTHKETRETERLPHNVSGGFVYDDVHHYHECQDCHAHVDEGEHRFETSVKKEPTCSESGAMHYECEICGYQKDVVIPATGIHNYVKGVCTYCGKTQGDCDHTLFHEETIDLEELGFCGGQLIYQSCECGAVKKIEETGLMFECDHSQFDQQMDPATGEMIATCRVCGLTYRGVQDYHKEGCTQVMHMDLTFSGSDGVSFLDATYDYSYTYHNNTKNNIISFEDSNVAVTYRECQDCHEITEIQVVDNYDELVTTERDVEVSSTLIQHIVTQESTSLGLRVVTTYSQEYLTTCSVEMKENIEVFVDGELVVSKVQSEIRDAHNWVITYELVGDTCDEGVNLTRTCTKCGTSQKGYTEGHSYSSSEVLDFSKYGNHTCNYQLHYSTCTYCGTPTFYNDINEIFRAHRWEMDEEVTTSYVEDGIQYQRAVGTCTQCGIKMDALSYMVTQGCTTRGYMDIKFYDVDDSLIISLDECQVYYESNHDLVYTDIVYEDEELGCEGGVSYTVQCSKCGEGYKTNTYNHVYNNKDSEEFILRDEESGVVLVSARYYTCALCHEVDAKEVEINYSAFVTSSGEEMIDGQLVEYVDYINAKNDIRVRRYNYNEEAGCYIYRHTVTEVVQNDETVFKTGWTERRENHQLIYNVRLFDETRGCEGGYSGVVTCANCDYVRNIDESYEHYFEEHYVDFTEYGSCPNAYISNRECQICHESQLYYGAHRCHFSASDSYYYPDHSETHNHYSNTKTCSECGLVVVEEIITDHGANCKVSETTNVTMSINGHSEEISRTNVYYEHELINEHYTLIGSSCEDYEKEGGWYYDADCSICKEHIHERGYGHRYQENRIDLSEYGACGGYIYNSGCIICGEGSDKSSIELQEWSHDFHYEHDEFVDEKGVRHETSHGVCSTCGLTVDRDSTQTLIPGTTCDYQVNEHYVVRIGKQVFEYDRNYHTDSHNVHTDYNIGGTGYDCHLEGVHVYSYCLDCGRELWDDDSYSHQTGNIIYVYFNGEDDEAGYISYYECKACGAIEDNYLSLNMNGGYNTESEEVFIDGVKYTIDTLTKSEDDIKVVITRHDEEFNQCMDIRYKVYEVYDGEELITSITTRQYIEKHNLIYGYIFDEDENCDHGVTITSTCVNCDYYDESHYSYHVTLLVDRREVDNSCGGYIAQYACPCGNQSRIENHLECDFRYVSNTEITDDVDPNIASHTRTIYTCEDCGYTYVVDYINRYVDDDWCEVDLVKIYSFGVDENYLNPEYTLTTTQSNYSHEHINLTKETSTYVNEEGNTVTVHTSTCDRCGRQNVDTEITNENGTLLHKTYVHELDNLNMTSTTTYDYAIYTHGDREFSLIISERYETSEGYWSEYQYEYIPGDICEYIVTHSNYYGDSDVEEREHHLDSHHIYNNDHSYSCTQYGGDGYYCEVCDHVLYEDELVAPTGHDIHYDRSVGLYICETCGFTSEVEPNPNFVIEDMSTEYSYRVGYYNPQGYAYDVEVSLIDVDNNETVIDFDDDECNVSLGRLYDYVGYYLDKEYVLYEANRLGVGGEYQVKITFNMLGELYGTQYSLVF